MCRAFVVESAPTARVIHSFAPWTQNERTSSGGTDTLPPMGDSRQPFVGSEALASGVLTRYELRRYYRAIMPDVYLDKRVQPTFRQRTLAAYLWSRREAVVSGLAASALHGAKWIDDNSPVELIWGNARSPHGVVTRDQLLLVNEIQRLDGVRVTTP